MVPLGGTVPGPRAQRRLRSARLSQGHLKSYALVILALPELPMLLASMRRQYAPNVS